MGWVTMGKGERHLFFVSYKAFSFCAAVLYFYFIFCCCPSHHVEDFERKRNKVYGQSEAFVSSTLMCFSSHPSDNRRAARKTVLINTVPCQHPVRLLVLFSRPLIIDEQLATPPRAQAAPLYFFPYGWKRRKLMKNKKNLRNEKEDN